MTASHPLPQAALDALAALRRRGGAATPWLAAALLLAPAGALTLLLAFAFGVDGASLGWSAAGLAVVCLGLPLAGCLQLLAAERAAPLPAAAPPPRPLAVTAAPRHAGGSDAQAFLAQAEREWARAGRYDESVALVLVEVDRLGLLIERFGSDGAQRALSELSLQAARTLRATDLLARTGEGRLSLLLPHADLTGAIDVADRIRERGAQIQVPALGGAVRITASLGVALMRPCGQPFSGLLDDAEAALRVARTAGGNCVRAAATRAEPAPARKPSRGGHPARGDD